MPTQALASSTHTDTDSMPDKFVSGSTAAASTEAISAEAAKTVRRGQDLHSADHNTGEPQTDQALSGSKQAETSLGEVPSAHNSVRAPSSVAVALEPPQDAAEPAQAVEASQTAAELPQAAVELSQAAELPEVTAVDPPQAVVEPQNVETPRAVEPLQAAAELSQAMDVPQPAVEPLQAALKLSEAIEPPLAAPESHQAPAEPPLAAAEPQTDTEQSINSAAMKYAELTATSGSAATACYAEFVAQAITSDDTQVLPHSSRLGVLFHTCNECAYLVLTGPSTCFNPVSSDLHLVFLLASSQPVYF